MDSLFLTILNMSITGAFVIAAICLARLPLRKAPKIISYCLWAVVGFRLVFPFSIESMFSLIPFNATVIPPDIASYTVRHIDSGIPAANYVVSNVLPAASSVAGASPLQVFTSISAYVWLAIAAILITFGLVSYLRLKIKMKSATHIEDNIYEADKIRSPFVLGIIKPKIYLPPGLNEHEYEYIVMHEQTHIQRKDHMTKVAAYLILCVHWFNPLAWAAFLLMSVDMEMSCDERVLKALGLESKKSYSLSLLSQASNKRSIGISPLAFSEGGLKARIKNVLDFKKIPMRFVITAAVLAVILSIGLTLNRVNNVTRNNNDIPAEESISSPYENREDISREVFMEITQRFDAPANGSESMSVFPNTYQTTASDSMSIPYNINQIYEKKLTAPQIHENLAAALETRNYIKDNVVSITMDDDKKVIEVSIFLTLQGIDKMTDVNVKWIVEQIHRNIPTIKLDTIKLSDNNMNIYDLSDIVIAPLSPSTLEAIAIISYGTLDSATSQIRIYPYP